MSGIELTAQDKRGPGDLGIRGSGDLENWRTGELENWRTGDGPNGGFRDLEI
jgi:hypothetical protein